MNTLNSFICSPKKREKTLLKKLFSFYILILSLILLPVNVIFQGTRWVFQAHQPRRSVVLSSKQNEQPWVAKQPSICLRAEKKKNSKMLVKWNSDLGQRKSKSNFRGAMIEKTSAKTCSVETFPTLGRCDTVNNTLQNSSAQVATNWKSLPRWFPKFVGHKDCHEVCFNINVVIHPSQKLQISTSPHLRKITDTSIVTDWFWKDFPNWFRWPWTLRASIHPSPTCLAHRKWLASFGWRSLPFLRPHDSPNAGPLAATADHVWASAWLSPWKNFRRSRWNAGLVGWRAKNAHVYPYVHWFRGFI